LAVFFASAAYLILGLSGFGISELLVFGCTMQPGPGPSGTEPNARVVVVSVWIAPRVPSRNRVRVCKLQGLPKQMSNAGSEELQSEQMEWLNKFVAMLVAALYFLN
jgi:hypothetical protein